MVKPDVINSELRFFIHHNCVITAIHPSIHPVDGAALVGGCVLQLHSGNTYVCIYVCIHQVKIHTVAAACRAAASVKRRLHGSQCPETKSLVRAHRLSSRLHSLSLSLSLLSDVLFVVVVVVVVVAAVGLRSSHRIAFCLSFFSAYSCN